MLPARTLERLKTSARRRHARYQKLRLSLQVGDGGPAPENYDLWSGLLDLEAAYMRVDELLSKK